MTCSQGEKEKKTTITFFKVIVWYGVLEFSSILNKKSPSPFALGPAKNAKRAESRSITNKVTSSWSRTAS